MQVRVSELEGEIELKAGHLKAVEEDRDRWQKRHQDVLQRYDRIDPKELEDLKKQIEDFKAERDQALQQVSGLNEQITDLTAKLEKAVSEKDAEVKFARDRFQKIHNERMGKKNEEMKVIATERDEAQKLVENLKQELEGLKQQLANAQTARADAGQSQERISILEKELEQARRQLQTVQQELEAVKAARDEAIAQANASSQQVGGADAGEGQANDGNSAALAQQVSALQKQLEEAQQKVAEAESNRSAAAEQLANLQAQLSSQNTNLERLQKETVGCCSLPRKHGMLTFYRRRRAQLSMSFDNNSHRHKLPRMSYLHQSLTRPRKLRLQNSRKSLLRRRKKLMTYGLSLLLRNPMRAHQAPRRIATRLLPSRPHWINAKPN